MKRLDLWRAQLQGAQQDRNFLRRQYNSLAKAITRNDNLINTLGKNIDTFMAKPKSKDS